MSELSVSVECLVCSQMVRAFGAAGQRVVYIEDHEIRGSHCRSVGAPIILSDEEIAVGKVDADVDA